MSCTKLLALSAALALAHNASAQSLGVTWSDDFDDGSAASRWTAPIVDAENGAFDGTVNYAFDYSTVGIPPAPGGTTTTGLLFEANRTDNPDANGNQGEAVGIIPTVAAADLPEGPYRMSVQAYYVVEGTNSGTTEFGIFGVHTAAVNAPLDEGLNDDVPFDFNVSNGNGLAWVASGDGGAFNDFHLFEDAGNADTGSQTGLGGFDALNDGDIPGLTGPVGDGPRGTWVEIAVERDGPIYEFSINGFVVHQYLDLADQYMDGSIMLGYADYFNSVGVTDLPLGPDPTPFDDSDGPFGDLIDGFGHFMVLDNLVIESIVPEPTSAAIAVIALGGLVARRRV